MAVTGVTTRLPAIRLLLLLSSVLLGASAEDDDRWHVVTHDGEWSGRVRQLAADGRVLNVELRMTLLASHDGRVTGGITLAREFDSEAGDQMVPEFSHDSQSVIDALQSQLAVLDHQGRVVATNLGWEERCLEDAQSLGAWVDAFPGNDYVTLLRTAGRARPTAREALAGLEGVLGGRLGQFSMDYDASVEGDERFFGLSIAPVGDRSGGAIVKHIDITWRKTLERQLSHRATHDALTGLPNRLLLDDRLTQALVRARRSGRLVAVMFVDLDQFKAVNDTLGHAAGDQVLVAVSRRLVRACRASDSVTRFGGDEFVLVVEDVDTLDNVQRIAQRVLDSMTTPIVVDGSELYFGASIGVAVTGGETPPATSEVEGLLRDADTAMYRAKESGRNTFVIFDPGMRERVANRLALTTALRHAVDRDELRLLYQPQFGCLDGEVVGAEALVRWHHPERGMVSPVEFIEAAEESGIIVEIGAWVLDEACRQAAEWQHRSAPRVRGARQPLAAPARRRQRRRPRAAHSRAARARPGATRPRDHRGRAHGRPGGRSTNPRGAERPRRADLGRRLRHGLLVACLPAALPRRHAQDRPLLRLAHRGRPEDRCTGAGHRRARGCPRPGHGRGGGRDRRAAPGGA